MITFRYVTDPSKFGKKYRFKTLKGAQKKALELVGSTPKLDPDGYLVDPRSGSCLFFQGCSLVDLCQKMNGVYTS